MAIDNPRRILPRIEMRGHPNSFWVVTAVGDYDAGLLLLDDIWSSGQIKVDGDIVVAVPVRDILLVTGSKNRAGLDAVRTIVAGHAKGRYRLTDTLFVDRKGRFVALGRP